MGPDTEQNLFVPASASSPVAPCWLPEMAAQAEAEGLTLFEGKNSTNSTGYIGVHLVQPGQPKPYQANVWRGGKQVSLGYFTTAAEALLCFGRTRRGGMQPSRR